MPYNCVADSFHMHKLCSRLSSSEGDLEATYDDHLRLIGKRIRDFLLVLIELFSLGVTAGATSDYVFKIGDFAPSETG